MSVFYKWDHHSHGWYSATCRPLLPKSKGTGYNCSGFISAWTGAVIKFKDGRVVRVVHEVGDPKRNGNQYNWTGEHMVKQTDEFLDWFEETFHQNSEHIELVRPALVFDDATHHTAREKDALKSTNLNVGIMMMMRDGWYHDDDGHKIVQSMQFGDNMAKGMKQILKERGYITTGLNRNDMRKALAKEPDFVEDARHTILRDSVLGGINVRLLCTVQNIVVSSTIKRCIGMQVRDCIGMNRTSAMLKSLRTL